MDVATLSSEGQVAIPHHLREALHLRPGDRLNLVVEEGKLIVERDESQRAKLIAGKFGRPVLVAPDGAPPMTAEHVRAILNDEE